MAEPLAQLTESPPLLTVSDLVVRFPVRTGLLQRTTGHVNAVDGVSFQIARGETLGLVGESGCGKTTVGRAVLRLVRADAGRVRFDTEDVLAARGSRLKELRRRMQIVFQDPAGSLDPRIRIGRIIGEGMLVHGLVRGRDKTSLRRKCAEVLERCGMPGSAMDRYPHEFSGGQRQRIAIARALALDPEFIVCDEPTSALDVSIQAQILNLLKDLQRDRPGGLTLLFISHDMAVIGHMCDRVAVMRGGEIVEDGPKRSVIHEPKHEYTRALLAAVPGRNLQL